MKKLSRQRCMEWLRFIIFILYIFDIYHVDMRVNAKFTTFAYAELVQHYSQDGKI